MIINDSAKLAIAALSSQRMRSFLTALGIAVGIASVVLLTSIGEGIHNFVLSEFTQFGTNVIAVSPGKTMTAGMSGAIISNVRPLSIDDALALGQSPKILGVVPCVQGNAPVEFGKRNFNTTRNNCRRDITHCFDIIKSRDHTNYSTHKPKHRSNGDKK